MNKGDLVNEVAKVVRTKKEAKAAVDTVIMAIADAMVNKENLTLVGLGTFKVVSRKARVGRNPKTGQEVKIPPRAVSKFIPGKALKEAVLSDM